MTEFIFNCLIDFIITINICELSRSQKVQIIDMIFDL